MWKCSGGCFPWNFLAPYLQGKHDSRMCCSTGVCVHHLEAWSASWASPPELLWPFELLIFSSCAAPCLAQPLPWVWNRNTNISWKEWCDSCPLSQTLSSWPCLSQQTPLQWVVLPLDAAPREEVSVPWRRLWEESPLCRASWMCCDRAGRRISSLLHGLSQENSKVTFLLENFSDRLIFPFQYKQPEVRLKGKFYVGFFPSRLWSSISTLGFEIIHYYHDFFSAISPLPPFLRCDKKCGTDLFLRAAAGDWLCQAWRELQVVHAQWWIWAWVMDLDLQGCFRVH